MSASFPMYRPSGALGVLLVVILILVVLGRV
jgi:hypothetical protein